MSHNTSSSENDIQPQGIIIAGANGSGKTTCAQLLLPKDTTFINADMIAQELTGLPNKTADLRAGRLLLDRMHLLESISANFAIETTLATLKLVNHIERIKKSGYQTHLLFLWLSSDELAWKRVLTRVSMGGHLVPEETVRRRYFRGLNNFFNIYRNQVDTWRIYDNSRVNEPLLIACGKKDMNCDIRLFNQWNSVLEAVT